MECEPIKQWLKDNKVCVVTNSVITLPGSLFLHSLKKYIDYIPENNFIVIPGINDNGKPKYGLSAFVEMVNILASQQYENIFDYAIYIDEDCFIYRFDLLLEEFKKFKEGNYCLAGLPDGGMICHRNQSRLLVNAFLSFWNIKAIRENHETYANWFNVLSYANKPYKAFMEKLIKVNDGDFYKSIDNASKNILKKCADYRIKNFKHDPPHATVVRNDPSNQYEPYQIPYSYKGNLEYNMEPYYLIEEAIIMSTQLPIYYLFGTDLYKNEDELFVDENGKRIASMDNSGITTVMIGKNNKSYAYHTWFARYYKPFVQNKIVEEHIKRIKSIIQNI